MKQPARPAGIVSPTARFKKTQTNSQTSLVVSPPRTTTTSTPHHHHHHHLPHPRPPATADPWELFLQPPEPTSWLANYDSRSANRQTSIHKSWRNITKHTLGWSQRGFCTISLVLENIHPPVSTCQEGSALEISRASSLGSAGRRRSRMRTLR